MKSLKKNVVIFLDRIKGEKIVRCYTGIITDETDSTLTVLMRGGKYMIISKQTLLEIKELSENG